MRAALAWSPRASGGAAGVLVLLTIFAATRPALAVTYDDPAPYCAAVGTIDKPDARYTGEAVPDWIARALMRATDAPAGADPAFFKHAAWRCDHGRVLACGYGANIPCDAKADTSRVPGPGANEFCRENPRRRCRAGGRDRPRDDLRLALRRPAPGHRAPGAEGRSARLSRRVLALRDAATLAALSALCSASPVIRLT
jgi:hypothetical protein